MKIVVAMSGGVDSSAVAKKMIDENYDVIGATLSFGKFCGTQTCIDAKKIADELGIELHIIECEKEFEENVVKYFASEYVLGNTPNPCVKCNRYIKFALLLEFAKRQNANYLATGHYAKIIEENGIFKLAKAKDLSKDQSYFLSQLKYEYLQCIKFPLGDMIKKHEVRKYANDKNLSVAKKSESQDICFTANKNYKDIVKQYYSTKSGDIIHVSGKFLGQHNGIINYTRGQRKGLGISYTEPLFVVDIDAENNVVYVGNEKDLMTSEFNIFDTNILYKNIEFGKEYNFDVKVRYSQNLEKAKVIFNKNGVTDVKLLNPSRNVAKGQLCCIYDGEFVVGSGFIRYYYG